MDSNTNTNDRMDSEVDAAKKMLAQDKLPFHRKITYGFTDMSGNLLYCIISSYMLYFFTNVFGLSVAVARSEEHTSELQSRFDLVCRLLLEKKKEQNNA